MHAYPDISWYALEARIMVLLVTVASGSSSFFAFSRLRLSNIFVDR